MRVRQGSEGIPPKNSRIPVSLHEGRMYYFDAQKAMEHSERLHELLADWRKGQKERKW